MSADPAVDWLLEGDPAIRWQTLRDLTDASEDEVVAERARVATEGLGAELLSRQDPDGHFGGEREATSWPTSQEWHALMSLAWLRDLGLDPAGAEARRAIGLVRDHVTWRWWDDNPFFVGEVEPCINGRVLAIGAYFGQDVDALAQRLLGEQMADGGWNCEQENGATVGSFASTINVLEGLLEYRGAAGGSDALDAALERGQGYLLDRRLFRRRSTGDVADPLFTRLSFPTSYHYDVLRALDHLRAAAVEADPRADEALEIVASKRHADGRWPLEQEHSDLLDLETGEREGEPSRWVTLRALRVLRWAGRD
jgi:hypothetical protein